MRRAVVMIILCHIIAFLGVLLLKPNKEVSVVKFFPLDEVKRFDETSTDLTLLSESDEDEYDFQWKTASTLEEPVYLRQDVSLLYMDGHLKGILSKWKENGQNLFQEQKIHGEDSSHYQAVTFHHGEIHYPDDKIKSIQDMSRAELYVIDSPLTPLESFTSPQNQSQEDWKRKLDHATEQQLHYQWNQLIEHYQIPKEQYEIIPLTDLPDYETKPFPKLTAEQTQQVIGQLWEGLYKNYVLQFTGDSQEDLNSYVPLVLADRDGKHLLVLFEDMDQRKQRLIQYYPDFSSD
ncbi:hypothetical protein [Pontibacillus marinus]|uniref:Uncharacterized protein n=1 Tax=Pontibacillus marinus BH030004 = DSM 16465 TaxID=1385511 RepID=A0A0A5FW84_9BACI|nr:hypothetical protein [Pontibacillus marinus]KGX85021.1 hypothetical protein N783_15505 [Pontibacillus marinus BH030004 = DSM 16465]